MANNQNTTADREALQERFAKYGTVYTPDAIREDVEDLVGLTSQKSFMVDFFESFQNYSERAAQLRTAKITLSPTMLLFGPPGTGKTSLVRAFARRYDIPRCVVEGDRLTSSLLGETVKNIRNAFEVARAVALERGSFILFFDEIDSIASERANAHEVGEIKRAVVSFLQIIDKITYEGVPLAIVGATNHQDQLDSAVWRRFIYHLEFEFPDASMRYEILNNYLERVQRAGIEVDVPLRSDLAAAVSTWNRQKKLVGLLKTTDGFTGADIERAMLMAIWRSLRGGVLKYADLEETLLTAGGTRIHVDQQHTLSKALAGQPSSGGGSGEDIDEY